MKDFVSEAYRQALQNGQTDLPFYKWHDTDACPQHSFCNFCHGMFDTPNSVAWVNR